MKYFLTFLATFIFSGISLACDCIMTPIESHIKGTDIIVVGQVSELLDKIEEGHYFQTFDPTMSYKVKIKILKSYKGAVAEGQIIELNSDYSNCSLYFVADGTYLLFLTKNKKSKKYLQRTCSYSEKIENAKKYIKAIEKQAKFRKVK